MLSILSTALIGLIVGAIAKLFMPGKDPGGWVVPMLLGLAGSFVGGHVGRLLGWYLEGQAEDFLMSAVGAILLLFLYRMSLGKNPA